MGSLLRALTLGLLAAVLLRSPEVAAQAAPSEHQLKAVFLFNFSHFVTWPAGTLPAEGRPFEICVFGQNPFDGALDEVCRGEAVSGRPLERRIVSDPAELGTCSIVYFPAGADPALPAAFASLPPRGVLTVGETSRFSDLGGIIRFELLRNRVRFSIDAKAAERTGLRVSSHLLKLAIGAER